MNLETNSYDKKQILKLLQKSENGLTSIYFRDLVNQYPDIADDEDIIRSIDFYEQATGVAFISKRLQEDKAFILSIARETQSPSISIFRQLKSRLRRDIDFIKGFIDIDHDVYTYVDKDLQQNIDLIKVFILKHGKTTTGLKRLPSEIKLLPNVFVELLKNKIVKAKHIDAFSPNLVKDTDFILSCCPYDASIIKEKISAFQVDDDKPNTSKLTSFPKIDAIFAEKAVSLNHETIYYFDSSLSNYTQLVSKVLYETQNQDYFPLRFKSIQDIKINLTEIMRQRSQKYILDGFHFLDEEALLIEPSNSTLKENLMFEQSLIVSCLNDENIQYVNPKSPIVRELIDKERLLRINKELHETLVKTKTRKLKIS